jgi:STE24 endopeptidase
VSRLILLLILGVWLIGAESVRQPVFMVRPGLLIFLAGYCALVLGVGVWARVLWRRAKPGELHESLRRFHRVTHFTRWIIPAWLMFGLFSNAAWGHVVLGVCGTSLQLPGVVLGTAPAFLAWLGLWWAEFPADRALREQSVLDDLYQNLPVRMPPGFRRHFVTALRQQLLPIVAPVLLIIFLRDVLMLTIGRHLRPEFMELLMLPAALAVYVLSPELLRRIFNARSLPGSPLRERLEEICRRSGVGCRDILLWQTDFSMANAAVIGIFPGLRYVLLSDRLLETMSDRQVEAVFAHELGHIVHRHMLWFMVFFMVLMLAALGPGRIVDEWMMARLPAWAETERMADWRELISAGTVFGGMLVFFGMLSRQFERQADIYAARMMDSDWGQAGGRLQGSAVGPRGAELFSSALQRVAVVNNIPLSARDWFHPSIGRRMGQLEKLGADPAKTFRFDRAMRWLYRGMIVALLACGALAVATW